MYTFIINPHSRSGKGLTIWHTVEAQLEQRQICYTAFFTKYQRQATTYVRKLTSDGSSRVLVVLGGDGTLNEVINGICFPERVTLGYIPTGSSNDFARSFGIPNDPLRALEIILNPGRTVHMDVGTMSYEGKHRRFAVSAGHRFRCRNLPRSGCFKVEADTEPDSSREIYLCRHCASPAFTYIHLPFSYRP